VSSSDSWFFFEELDFEEPGPEDPGPFGEEEEEESPPEREGLCRPSFPDPRLSDEPEVFERPLSLPPRLPELRSLPATFWFRFRSSSRSLFGIEISFGNPGTPVSPPEKSAGSMPLHATRRDTAAP
jgi:hypothetical protein